MTRLILALAAACMAAAALPSAAHAATVAAWHMNETSGSVMRDAAGSHNGRIYSTTLGAAGFAGTAYQFDGTRSYVRVPSAWSLNPGSSAFAINVHVRLSDPPPTGDYDIVKKGNYDSPGGEYKVEIVKTGQALCAFKGNLRYAQVVAGPSLTDGRWHTIRCALRQGKVSLTVGGTVYSNSRAVGTVSNSSPIGIGAGPAMDFYEGVIDELVITRG